MNSPPQDRLPLSAHSQQPEAACYLRAINHDLVKVLGPEIKSDSGRSILDMLLTLLRHVIAREEVAASFLEGHVTSLLSVVADLAAVSGSDSLTAQVRERQASLTTESARQVYDWTAQTLEALIQELSPRLAKLTASERATVHAALRKAEESERQWHQRSEARENELKAGESVAAGKAVTTEILTTYLQARDPQAPRVTASRILSVLGGNSKDTIIAELQGPDRVADRIVIRRDVPNGPFDVTATDELGVLTALHEAKVPVAKPLWVERNPQVLGAPFLVTGFSEGAPAADLSTNVREEESPQQAMLVLAQVLAKVHAVDVTRIPGSEAIAGHSVQWHVTALIDLYEDQWRRRRVWFSPVLASAFAWLRANVSSEALRPAIVHGDASIRNLLVHKGKATAIIDWETWHIGDPAEDIAYAEDEISPHMSFDQFLSAYYESGGNRISPERMKFWSIWRHVRNAVSGASMIEGTAYGTRPGVISPYSGVRWYRYTVQRVAELLTKV